MAGKSQESGKKSGYRMVQSGAGTQGPAADISRLQYEENARLMGSAVQGRYTVLIRNKKT